MFCRSASLYQLWSQFRMLVSWTTLHSKLYIVIAWKDNTKRNNCEFRFSTLLLRTMLLHSTPPTYPTQFHCYINERTSEHCGHF